MSHSENLMRFGPAEIVPLTTKTVPPYTTTNTVIYGNKDFIVVDPGTANVAQQEVLAQHVKKRIDKGNHFLGIYLTHHHSDHVRAATFLAGNFNVDIYAHKNAEKLLRFPVSHLLDDGQKITVDKDLTIEALYTPGHAQDHLVFFDRTHGILLAGDMITDRGTVLIPPLSGNLTLYLESLEKISRLPLLTLIPAHGTAITSEPNIFLQNGLKHRYERILSVVDTLINSAHKPLDASDITALVYRNLVSIELMAFAQLSVESSLAWLLEKHLVEYINHKWHAAADVQKKRRESLVSSLENISKLTKT